MKKQKFYPLTFYFANFGYLFGRNVLESILCEKFPFKACGESGATFAGSFKRQFPTINEITISEITIFERKEIPMGGTSLDMDRLLILKIK